MRGLDPRIHADEMQGKKIQRAQCIPARRMDCRVKPGNDDRGLRTRPRVAGRRNRNTHNLIKKLVDLRRGTFTSIGH
jgi:hypothetical protein